MKGQKSKKSQKQRNYITDSPTKYKIDYQISISYTHNPTSKCPKQSRNAIAKACLQAKI